MKNYYYSEQLGETFGPCVKLKMNLQCCLRARLGTAGIVYNICSGALEVRIY